MSKSRKLSFADPDHEATQETLALLKILALGNREVGADKVKPIADAVRRLRARKTGTFIA